jgi:hypothetical protein
VQNKGGTITFGAHKSTATLTVTPPTGRNWKDGGGDKQIVLTLYNSAAQALSSDTVYLFDYHSTTPSRVNISAIQALATQNQTPPANATFKFWRDPNGAKATTLDVYFQLGGEADPVLDYSLFAANGIGNISSWIKKVTIQPNQDNVVVTLRPINPNQVSPSVKSVIVTLLPAPPLQSLPNVPSYQMGKFFQAALRIRDSNSTTDFIPDTDHDGVNDVVETTATTPTDALNHDSDGNGIPDGLPITLTDTDGDGISDADESVLYTLKTNTDGDAFSDFKEVLRGTDPTVANTSTDTTPPTVSITSITAVP